MSIFRDLLNARDYLEKDDMSILKKIQKNLSVRKEILWKDPTGITCVVRGPFPPNFMRTLAYKSKEKAINAMAGDIITRDQTTSADAYAKTLTRLIEDSHNEYGEIAP